MPAASQLSAVVVDDQLTMRTLIRDSLNAIGIKDTRLFASANEAFPALKARKAHVVLSDFNMPEVDGLEFLRVIRAVPEFKNIAFFLLTGRADKELVQRAVQYGANNYVVKPFTTAMLKEKLEQVFGALS